MGSYKARSWTTYQPMRSTLHVVHEVFRREWEANFDAAMEKARQLEKQGFLVEECLQKGAMMESKAKQLSKQLQERGFQVELIPVARWGKEQAVFLVYKPPEKPVEPKPAPSKPLKPLTTQRIIQNFYKTFKVNDDPSMLGTEGVIMDVQHMVGIVDIAFTGGTTGRVGVCERGRKAKQSGLKLAEFYNNAKLREALIDLERLKHRWVSPDSRKDFPIPINVFRKVLRALDDGPITAYAPDQDGPVFFFNERAPSNISVACVKDINALSLDTDTIDYVIDIAKSAYGYKPPQ